MTDARSVGMITWPIIKCASHSEKADLDDN